MPDASEMPQKPVPSKASAPPGRAVGSGPPGVGFQAACAPRPSAYSSAVASLPPLSIPPARSTSPDDSNVAVCEPRAFAKDAVAKKAPAAGS